ncbi:dTDP-4-dehydrorhamnose reductase [Rubritalea marina]|uniref:dTDP-4-dehydrorhamnose reductase n=1 Tax=Rubritalea marina TaxID=361055 RepID=UPI0003701761|nr:dTDP-4-dehydrorhamnose reductase [Rubritalea marina]
MNDHPTKRVLVIGKSGQLAKALTSLTGEFSKCSIHAVGRPELDITNVDSVKSVLEVYCPDVVINASAYTAVDQAESDIESARNINATAVQTLARLCAQASLQLIHISTDYVFDGTATAPLKESDAVAPMGVYGQTKLEGEQFAVSENPSSIIVRTSWLYGDHGNNFVSTMLRLAEQRHTLGVVSDQFGRPTYASDLARTLMIIGVHASDDDAGVYHYSNDGEPTSWYGFANEVFTHAKALGLKVPDRLNAITTEDFPTPAKRPAWSVMNLDKIQSTFNLNIPDWKSSLSKYFQNNY